MQECAGCLTALPVFGEGELPNAPVATSPREMIHCFLQCCYIQPGVECNCIPCINPQGLRTGCNAATSVHPLTPHCLVHWGFNKNNVLPEISWVKTNISDLEYNSCQWFAWCTLTLGKGNFIPKVNGTDYRKLSINKLVITCVWEFP